MFGKIISSPARRATLSTLMAGVAGQLALLVTGIISARLLGAEDRGYLALYVLFPTVLVSVFGMGLPQAITFYIARNRNHVRPIARQVLGPYILQVFAIAVLHLLTLHVYQRYDPGANAIVGYLSLLVVPGMLAQQYLQSILQGIGSYTAFNIARLLMPVFYALVMAYLYVTGTWGLLGIAFAWVFVTSLAAVLSIVIVRKEVRLRVEAERKGNPPDLKSVIRFGLRGLLGSASPLEVLKIDQFIAGILLSPLSLGVYVVAQAFSTLPRFVGQSVGMIVYPIVASHGSKDKMSTVWRVFRLMLLGNTAIVLILIAIMPVILPLFFGEEFRGAVIPSQILLVGALFISLRRPLAEGVRGCGHPEVSSYGEISIYPVLAICALLLIPSYGITGLAVSVSAGLGTALVVTVILSLRIPATGSA